MITEVLRKEFNMYITEDLVDRKKTGCHICIRDGSVSNL